MKYVLGLGSNLGPSLATFRRVVPELARLGIRTLRLSPLYESEAMLPMGDDRPEWRRPFLNAAILCESDRDPRALLAAAKECEACLGRQSRERWAPREIDIDILWWEGGGFDVPELRIPHVGLSARPFALLPAADVWPPAFAADLASRSEWKNAKIDRVPYRTRRARKSWTEIVGVLNVTPDSFSDGGMCFDPAQALKQARRLVADGASILDVGAESTRPGARALEPGEEWARLEPVLIALLRERHGSPEPFRVSVDTRHPETAARALLAGVDWINDVSGLQNPAMIRVLRESDCPIVIMHSLSVPADPSLTLPEDEDPVQEIERWTHDILEALKDAGIFRRRLILDPGLGFGKTLPQNWEVVRRLAELHRFELPLYVGHSRKSFLAAATDAPASGRDLESAVLSTRLAASGAAYLRVHDVAATERALATWAWSDGVVRLHD